MILFKKMIANVVRDVMKDEFANQRKELLEETRANLDDITYRMGQIRELADEAVTRERRIQTTDLNIATHMVDGYLFTNNSTVVGNVAWSDLNITYKGVTYAITNGDTANKYIWFDFDATTNTTLVTSNTKPTLAPDDMLIGINDGGIFTPTFVTGKMGHGAAIGDGTVNSGELGSGAVTTAKIASAAVGATQLGGGAVTEFKLGTGAVSNAKLATNAVDANKIASGAVTDTKIGTGAVTNTKLGASAVDAGNLATNAVTAVKIATGAVTNTKLGSGAVTDVKIGSGAVTNVKIGSGAVTGIKLGAGAVAEDKLNLATHFIF